MEDLVVSTMPIKPYKKINQGLMISPILVETLGKVLSCNKTLFINLMHSFDNKVPELNIFLNSMERIGASFDKILKDIDWYEDYLSIVEQLYKKGYIVLKIGKILRCECGRVELASESLNNKDGDLYYWDQNKVICRHCKKECKEYLQKNLYLDIKKEFCEDISISPSFSKKEILNLSNYYNNRSLLISKSRQTNYSLNIDGYNMNIDVDMLWRMFNLLLNEEKQVLIVSNHQLYEIFISNYINKILNKKRVHYIATPYLKNNENIDFDQKVFSKKNILYKKMAILYNLKWKYQTSNWNNGILEILNKLSDAELEELYDIILNIPFDSNSNLEAIVNSILSGINLNKNIKSLRLGR